MVWLIVTLPALAVVASVASGILAATRGDHELSTNYHWEGDELALDDTHAARAAQLQLAAELRVDAAAGRCEILVHGVPGMSAYPATLRLDLTHATDPSVDRHLLLARSDTPAAPLAHYSAPCSTLRAAHWWVQLSDQPATWLLRARTVGTLNEPLSLSAVAQHRGDAAGP